MLRQPILKAPEVLLDEPQNTVRPVGELRHNAPHLGAYPRGDFLTHVRARTRAAPLQTVLLCSLILGRLILRLPGPGPLLPRDFPQLPTSHRLAGDDTGELLKLLIGEAVMR